MKSGEGMFIIIWKLREKKYFVDYCEIFYLFEKSIPITVVPYIGFKYRFPVMVPYWAGVCIVWPDGTIEDYTPQEAQALSFAQGYRLFPEKLGRIYVESFAYKKGIVNKWFLHREQIEIPKGDGETRRNVKIERKGGKMKIISVRRGFVTNSSSENYWFFLVERGKEAEEEMTEEIATELEVDLEDARRALKQCLRKPRRKEVYGVYSYRRILDIESPEVIEAYERLVSEVAQADDAKLEVKVKKLLQTSKRYEEEEAERPPTKEEISHAVVLLSVFRVTEQMVKSKGGKLLYGNISVPTGEYAYDLADVYETGSGLDFQDETEPGTTLLSRKFVVENMGDELESFPVIDLLEGGKSYAIIDEVTEDYYPFEISHLKEVIEKAGMFQEFEKFIEQRCQRGDPASRLAREILQLYEGEK